MKMKMWLVALLLISEAGAHADDSALQAVLSQKGLKKITHWLTDWLQDDNVTLPEVKGSIGLIIGHMDYVLHDMSVQRCDLPEPSVAFSEGSGVSLQVHGLSVAITGQWNIKYGFLKGRGRFELVLFSVNLDTLLQLSSENQHLSIYTAVCSSDIESVKLNIYGGMSFVLQPILNKFNKRVVQEIRAQICKSFKKGVEALESRLAAVSVALKVDPYVYINISLTESPLVKDSGLGLNVKGEFYSNQSPSEPPFPPNPFSLSWQESYMVSVGASEFLMNSAAFAYHRAGALHTRITDDMIPRACPYHLNTSQVSQLIPQLSKLYPDRLMELQLYTREAPELSFNKTLIRVRLSASVEAYVWTTDCPAKPLFTLGLESSFRGKAYVDKYLKGAVDMMNLTLELEKSEIGDFPVAPVQDAVKSVMSNFVLPKINAQLKDGLPLPYTKGFGLKNSVLTIEDGFLAIATDITGPFMD